MSQNGIYVGLMSGTSMDAVDIAIVEFADTGPKVLAYEQFPISRDIKAVVRRIDGSTSIDKVTEIDSVLGHLFADSVAKALSNSGIDPSDITAIGSHGQTILHLPEDAHARTLQIGDPNIIAFKTGISTVADFRRMDMASGGEGAPLAPAFHEIAFRTEGAERVILNLGGIANITLLPGEASKQISGFDTGPGNGLLDDWNYNHNHTPMDRNSEWAATGNVHQELLDSFLTDPYFELTAPKSTGRDHFNTDWIYRHVNELQNRTRQPIAPEDVQATLLALTVENIASAIETNTPNAAEIYVCGGGAHNPKLMNLLSERLSPTSVQDTNVLGLDPDAIEAITFAWLAKQTINAAQGNKPSVTGARKPQILGGIYQAMSV